MSQKVSRKSAVTEEKEKVIKRQTHSPVKEMKKKMAANAEKEKQAAEKASDKQAEKTVEKPTVEKAEKPAEKVVEKAAEKAEKHDKNEKPDKGGDKKAEKLDKTVDKKAEKLDKNVDKKAEKQTKEEQKKPEPQPEKSKAESSKEDKSGKPEKPDSKKAEPSKAKQNGRDRVHNGVSDVTLSTNGTDDVLNGTVKATRTPETPRPASDKQPDKDADDPKDKVLKLKEDATAATDRRLRSSNSPKPQEGKKSETTKKDKLLDSPKKSELEKVEEKDESAAKNEKNQEMEIEVVLEVPGNEGEEAQDKERSKTDTNFSKSRVKVSPYRRSMRLADQTNTSLQANYTGNNTTMEMDLTETSSFMEDAPLDDSSYLRGLRSIRGRSSYKPLKEITLRHVTANKSARSTASTSIASPASDSHNRPTGTVVGRKRKPDSDDVELGADLAEPAHVATKRMRVLDRLAEPFRRVAAAAALPAVARRNAEIVGINTDLPLTAPVASGDTFDPESLKQPAPAPPPAAPVAAPLACDEKDNKRCAIM